MRSCKFSTLNYNYIQKGNGEKLGNSYAPSKVELAARAKALVEKAETAEEGESDTADAP